MSNLDDARAVRTRAELAQHVRTLAAELIARPEGTANADVASFLEAMGAWIEDMDGYYANRGETVPVQPQWSTLAEIISAARSYE